jgi:hypothetical protein
VVLANGQRKLAGESVYLTSQFTLAVRLDETFAKALAKRFTGGSDKEEE